MTGGIDQPENADAVTGDPSPAPAGDIESERSGAGTGATVDLDAVERDLDDVETALGRLDDGTYWTDEVTGEEIPDEVLAEDPAARRA